MTILFGILLALFIAASIYTLRANFSLPVVISQLAGFLGVAYAFMQSLSKDNLRVYFWLQRIRIWWNSDLVTKWWFGARFDGDYPPEIIENVVNFLNDKEKFRFRTNLDYRNDREIQVEIDETLTVKISFDPASLSAFRKGHVAIASKALEVSYGHARKKLDTQIVPVILALKNFLKPEFASYELDVEFADRNPFFAVYIAHLKPEQIGDFKVLLHLDAYSPSRDAEKVEISRRNLHITTLSTDSFKQLALDFILLSADVRVFAGAR